ncbi:MAG TPA: class I SAM-dependent methyltransferase [Solirubrobacteraceae bacterium]|nr:class I SAM-dependent methyltransferase [Solirubrobacteraceae bacterium]
MRDVDRLAAEALAGGDPTGWFERLYAAHAADHAEVPWDRGAPHPLLVEWIRADPERARGAGRRAIVVGCGFGADAEYLAELGFATTGFDISATAIAGARARSIHPQIEYRAADLLALPDEWRGAFEFVHEALTVQALPDPPRAAAIAGIASLVAPGGRLLVILSARRDGEPSSEAPPWRILRREIDAFAAGTGLAAERIELIEPTDGGPGPRWRATFTRGA